MATYMTRDGHIMDDLAVSSMIGASLPTGEACRAAVALLHTALAHQVSLAELWELSRIAVWGGGLVAARSALRAIQASQPLTDPTTRTVAPAPATAPQKGLAWSEEIAWNDDEAPPAPAAPAGDDIVADFDRALAQMSLL
jgi:hypothetical protein